MNTVLNTGLRFIPIVGGGKSANTTNIGGASTKGAVTGATVPGSNFNAPAAGCFTSATAAILHACRYCLGDWRLSEQFSQRHQGKFRAIGRAGLEWVRPLVLSGSGVTSTKGGTSMETGERGKQTGR